ncbi:hypothetical protein EDB89DRAFT_1908423 [Lactarius sanguifluus]|nr:hypothetical protein EDB89DRAFT_1908423 [Lactarius sanguifluus]
MSTRPCGRLPTAKLAADDSGEPESTGFSLHGPDTSENCVNTIPQVIPSSTDYQRSVPTGMVASAGNLFGPDLRIPDTSSPVPIKLLLPGPITLYHTTITSTLLACFPLPCLATSESLNLALNSSTNSSLSGVSTQYWRVHLGLASYLDINIDLIVNLQPRRGDDNNDADEATTTTVPATTAATSMTANPTNPSDDSPDDNHSSDDSDSPDNDCDNDGGGDGNEGQRTH